MIVSFLFDCLILVLTPISFTQADMMDIKVLQVGQELMKETLPLQPGSRLYELQGLNSNKWYEVKISYPASIPATFTLQLSKGSSGLNVGRKLLNTEKIIFQADSLQLLGGKGGTFVLVNMEPEGIVAIPGSNGRAFCYGADVDTLYELIKEGVDECKKFFQTLYKFVYLLGTYLKPNVAILDGVTMGSGAGISLPGMFRVVTNRIILLSNALIKGFDAGAAISLEGCHDICYLGSYAQKNSLSGWATCLCWRVMRFSSQLVYSNPEAQIGFHPDAGASYYLSRLPGYLGEYLALTGEKINGVEMIACGLATHYSHNEKLLWIEERIGKLITDDRLVTENSISQYGDLVYPNRRSVLYKFEKIDKCFSQDTVEEIIETLEREATESHDEWCNTALNKIKEASPLSLKVALKSIREGRFQPLDQCLVREYRISVNWVSKRVSGDFCEGVRARLVDKDFAPKWDQKRLEEVTSDMVDRFFNPLDELEPELNLATAIREPSM